MISRKMIVRTIAVLCALLLQLAANAQNIFVPYRVGNLFGIADEHGKLKLNPVFDNVRLCDADNYFTGYKNTANGYSSSLVFRDKVILKDQAYFGYYPYNDIVVAVQKTDLETGSYYSFGNELSHVYNNKGQRILPGEYSYVEVYVDFDTKNESPLALIGVFDVAGKYSLVVYDKPKAKIVKELLTNISVEQIDTEMARWQKVMTVLSKSVKNRATQYTISFVSGGYTMTQEEVEFYSEEDAYWDAPVAMPDFDEAPRAPKPVATPATIQTVERRLNYKQFNAKDKLYFEAEKLNTEYFELISEGGKTGIKLVKDDKILVPAAYDALYRAEFAGIHYSGYIVLADGKYGVYINPMREETVVIPPTFAFMPWLERFDYGKEGFHLIALFDADGVFHHFANQDGEEYYRAE